MVAASMYSKQTDNPQSKGSLGCLPHPQSPALSETPHPLPSSPQSQVSSLEGIGRRVQKKKGVGSEGKICGQAEERAVRGRQNGV